MNTPGSNWLTWGAVLALGFPLAVILLGMVVNGLQRRGSVFAVVTRQALNLLLPLLAVYLFLRHVVGSDFEQVGPRVVMSLVLICVVWLALSFTNAVVFGAAPADSARARTPRLLRDLIQVMLVIVGIAVVLATVWQQDVAALFTAMGVGSIVIGLALQNTLGNVMSGIALLLERPFSEGDWVEIAGVEGQVSEINWRAVRIETRTGDLVVVPHSAVAGGNIVNNSQPDPHDRVVVELGFDYRHPPNQVKAMLLDVMKRTEGVLAEPEPAAGTVAYGDSSINYRIGFSVESPAIRGIVRESVMTQIWYASQREKINIPFPIRTVYTFDGDTEDRSTPDAMRQAGNTALLRGAFDGDQLDALGQGASLKHFGRGETALAQGGYGERLFLVVAGSALLVNRGPDARTRELFSLQRGDFFGEISLLSGGASPYGVVAEHDLQVLSFTRDIVDRLIDGKPSLAVEIGKVMDLRRKAIDGAR